MVKQAKNDVEPGAVVGALSAVIRAEHRHAAHLGPALGLGLSEVMALYHLANEPLTAGMLGDRVGLSTGSTTALIDRLAAHDLVVRKSHPKDRRAVIIELTPNGHGRTFERMQHFIVAVEQLCVAMDPEDRRVVEEFLRSLEHIIDADTDRLQIDR